MTDAIPYRLASPLERWLRDTHIAQATGDWATVTKRWGDTRVHVCSNCGKEWGGPDSPVVVMPGARIICMCQQK